VEQVVASVVDTYNVASSKGLPMGFFVLQQTFEVSDSNYTSVRRLRVTAEDKEWDEDASYECSNGFTILIHLCA
jgi:hypothetical protein